MEKEEKENIHRKKRAVGADDHQKKKDEILALASEHNALLYWMATVTSALTAFYMGRLFWTAFWGKDDHGHAHESPAVMTLPLVFLAVLSVIGGFIGIPHFLYPSMGHPHLNIKVALISSFVAILGLSVSYLIYSKRPTRDPLETKLGFIYPILKNKYYFDVVYGWYVDRLQQCAAYILSLFETILIDRAGVHGVTTAAQAVGKTLRYLQNGLVQFYALIFVLGVVYLFYTMVAHL